MTAPRYRLLSKLASGGMGEVFIAVQTGADNFEKRVALKLLLPHVSQEPHSVQMFLDEARISARMNHPNIVPVFDFGELGGQYYLAMALVEGVSLTDLLKALRANNELLPIPLFRVIANSLCEALAYSHALTDEQGNALKVVHRDVSPSNLLIARAGAVLLSDFGIAKAATNTHATLPGDVRGKFAYMAPEQMASLSTVDARVDQYSAAVTLYQTLTGVSPFRRSSEPETIDAVRRDDVPLLTAARPDVSPQVAAAIARGMSRAANDRFPDMEAFRAAVIDGPMSPPQALGALVARLCPEALAKLTGTPAAGSAPLPQFAAPQTLSVPADSLPSHALSVTLRSPVSPPEPPRSNSRIIAGVGVMLATAVATIALALLLQRPAPVPAENVRAPALAQPRPEPEAKTSTDAGTLAEAPPPDAGAPRPAVVTKRPRVPNGMSSLSADAKPWAEVLLDGHVLDHTPIAGYPVASGVHDIVFRHPSLGTVKKRVKFSAGVETTVRADIGAGTVRVGR